MTRIGRRLSTKWQSVKQRLVHGGHSARHWLLGSELADTIIILLTNPRSGSTWLLDMLRCHPSISMHLRYEVYDRLGLGGRRYPRDLSGYSDAARKIEVVPETWEGIPQQKIEIEGTDGEEKANIEKIHPHFFDHRVPSFVERAKSLAAERNVRFIYQVRDPKATLVSFLEYKRRNSSWDHRALDEIPAHLRRIYESILDVSELIPGLAVDYDALSADVVSETERVLCFARGVDTVGVDIQRIQDKTSREKRKSTGTSFVGEKRSGEFIDDYEAYFAEHRNELDRCYAAYDALRSTV